MNVSEQVLILVAEDDSDDRFLLTEAFQTNGFDGRLQFAYNGEEVIKQATELIESNNEPRQPALILLDLNMPIKSGCEALKELKAHPGLSKIPVVMLSTTDSQSEMEKCFHLGAVAYLKKPNDFEELLQMVSILYKYISYPQLA